MLIYKPLKIPKMPHYLKMYLSHLSLTINERAAKIIEEMLANSPITVGQEASAIVENSVVLVDRPIVLNE